MKKQILSLLAPLIMSSSPLITHAQPTLTWNEFSCTHYKPAGFHKAGIKRNLYLIDASEDSCIYGYDKNHPRIMFQHDEYTLNTASAVFKHFMKKAAKQYGFEIQDPSIQKFELHGHPSVLITFGSNDGLHVPLNNTVCSAVKTSYDGLICISELDPVDTMLTDQQLIGLARATIK